MTPSQTPEQIARAAGWEKDPVTGFIYRLAGEDMQTAKDWGGAVSEEVRKPIDAHKDGLVECLARIKKVFDECRFTAGDCHSLALALYRADAGKGSLLACLRKEVEDGGEVFSTTYSHMVYEDADGVSWDIDGAGADEKWEAQWPDEPDENGFVSKFEWIYLAPEQVRSWVLSHQGRFDDLLTADLSTFVEQKQAVSLAPRRVESRPLDI